MPRLVVLAFAATGLLASLSAAARAAEPGFGPPERTSALERIASLIENRYVYKDKAVAIAAEVRGLKSDRELSDARDQSAWSAVLTRRLEAHDVHFHVSWSAAGPRGAQTGGPSLPSPAVMERRMARDNFGFEDVERLGGNIGYLRLSFFAHFDRTLVGDKTPEARKSAEAALKLLAHTDAVIFDLRQNMGGSPAMIDYLLSGFFGDKPVLLNRFFRRETDSTVDFTTFTDDVGPRRPGVPIYVLVSGRTVSAAEEFAYDVQTQKRGVVVGEPTAGGANPGGAFDAGDGFRVFVSTGAAINPITHTNWEGAGVTPDVVVPAADALSRAHSLALEAVLGAGASSTPVEARWALERLNAVRSQVRLNPSDLAAYTGAFGDRSVTARGGELYVSHDRAPAQRLIPLGADGFAVDGDADERVIFDRGGAQRAKALIKEDLDGGAATYVRTGDAAPLGG